MMTKKAMFEYLEELRKSGVTNMWGARPYLMNAFDLDAEEAKEVLVEWITSHNSKLKAS